VFDDGHEHHPMSMADFARPLKVSRLALAGFLSPSTAVAPTSIVYSVLVQGCSGGKPDGVRVCASGSLPLDDRKARVAERSGVDR
jgi:hypothetical protein